MYSALNSQLYLIKTSSIVNVRKINNRKNNSLSAIELNGRQCFPEMLIILYFSFD